MKDKNDKPRWHEIMKLFVDLSFKMQQFLQIKPEMGNTSCPTHLILSDRRRTRTRKWERETFSLSYYWCICVWEDMTLHRCFLHIITGSKTRLESDHLYRAHASLFVFMQCFSYACSHLAERSWHDATFPVFQWGFISRGLLKYLKHQQVLRSRVFLSGCSTAIHNQT